MVMHRSSKILQVFSLFSGGVSTAPPPPTPPPPGTRPPLPPISQTRPPPPGESYIVNSSHSLIENNANYYIDTDETPGFLLLLKNHIFTARS